MLSRTQNVLCSGLIGLLVAVPAVAQNRAAAGIGAGYESYTFKDENVVGIRSITLLTAPFAARIPLGSRVWLEATGAWARGELERADGSVATLAGLTDTQVALGLAIVPDRLSIALVGLAPTGTAEQNAEEAEVAGAIAADLIPFRISNWGSGGGIGVTTTIAHSFGRVGAGISGAYLVGREFDLLEAQEFAYRPGDQLVIRGALDATVGSAGKLGLQLTLQQAKEDQVNGSNLYRPGRRYQVIGSYQFAMGQSSGVVYGGAMHRAQGTFLLETGSDAPAQDLILVGGGLRIALGRSVVFAPGGDLRLQRRADGTDQGYSAGVGGSIELGSTVKLIPSVRGRFGNVLVREGIETGFSGLDAGLTLRFGGR